MILIIFAQIIMCFVRVVMSGGSGGLVEGSSLLVAC